MELALAPLLDIGLGLGLRSVLAGDATFVSLENNIRLSQPSTAAKSRVNPSVTVATGNGSEKN